jgi:hypothetical protein
MGVRKIMATMTRWTPPQGDLYPLSSPLSKLDNLITYGTKRRRRRRELTSIITLYYIHLITHLEGGDHKVTPNPILTVSLHINSVKEVVSHLEVELYKPRRYISLTVDSDRGWVWLR